MSPKQITNKALQSPEFQKGFSDFFPKYVRYGLVGFIALEAMVIIHNKFSDRTTENAANLDHVDTINQNNQAA